MKAVRPVVLFGIVSIMLATLVPPDHGSVSSLIAASSDCGDYSGPVCSETTNCIFFIFKCSTSYKYYKNTDSEEDEEEKVELEPTGG